MLEILTNTFGVAGCDNEVKELILKEITPFCDNIEIMKDGNIIAFKKGRKTPSKKIMLSAHTDEVGFMVKDITEEGYLELCEVGGVDSRILLSKRVFVGEKKIPGIIGIKAVHMTEKDEREKIIPIEKMYVDIGAYDYQDALKYVKRGDYIAFDSEYTPLGEKRVVAKALDDRVGVSVLIKLLKEEVEYDFYAVFNSLEEIGLKGAVTASYKVNPDIALIMEGTTCSDVKGTKEHLKSTTLGKGGVLSIADRTSVSNRKLNDFIIKLSEKFHIPVQIKGTNMGGNDAGAIQVARDGVKTAVLSVPLRYIHSPVSVMDKGDYESVYKMALAFVNNIGEFCDDK